MAYKLKPNKSMLSRFKVTKSGKLKRHHAKTSHLMTVKNGSKKRLLRRPAILHEGIARNLRRYMGLSHLNPIRDEHQAAVAAKQAEKAAAQPQA